ncbi:hypothetical protein ACYOEI_03335 [Singulisphaera rosea]
MRLPRLRVRTCMVLVGAVALLVWGAMMGLRSYNYFQLASFYSFQGYHYRENAQRDLARGRTRSLEARWGMRISDYYKSLERKYRSAMWRPWLAIEIEPPFFDPEQLTPFVN